MSKILRLIRFFCNSAKISVIGIKCPSFGQMSIFWGLVFCKQLYNYVSNNLWNKNRGSLAVMGGSFFGGPLFEGVRGGAPPTFSEFVFRQKLLNWQIWKVKRFQYFQIYWYRSTTLGYRVKYKKVYFLTFWELSRIEKNLFNYETSHKLAIAFGRGVGSTPLDSRLVTTPNMNVCNLNWSTIKCMQS